MLVLGFVLSVLWGVSYLGGGISSALSTIFSPVAGIMAVVTTSVTLTLYLLSKDTTARWFAFVSYGLMVMTAGYIIATTGHAESPFIVLWMVLGLFCGLFGLIGFGPVAIIDAAYVAYLFSSNHADASQTITFVIVFVVPLVISVLIWRHKDAEADDSTKAYSALARELNQVANKSEIVINGIADGVIAIDGSGTIQLINPAAQSIMGWGKQDAMELDYRSVFKLFDNKDQPLTEPTDPIQQVLHGSKSVTRNDLSLATSTGKKMIISLLISPVGQAGSGAIIVFRDITGDVVENRQKAEFISTASHEMRTPVAAIEGYIGLALNPATATIDDKARSFLTKAHESAQHLGHLFQDLLDVSKAEDGRLGNNPTVIDVTTFVRDVTSGLMASAVSKQLTLVYGPDAAHTEAGNSITPAYYVRADQSHYREVLSNLIENAIKYTKSGGTITVDITGDDAHVVVSVVDNGIGIPKEDISHLFQKFYRVDNTDTREIGGTGLGLYLCRRLVEAMDGRIWVESDYGKGSMFFVELSRISSGEASKETSPVSPATPAATPPTAAAPAVIAADAAPAPPQA